VDVGDAVIGDLGDAGLGQADAVSSQNDQLRFVYVHSDRTTLAEPQ
jgi:hypothetical protein